jgi:CRP/FNR family transcriptional regulator, cyclic AMP receptor protein
MPELFDLAVLAQDESCELCLLLQRCPDVEPRRYTDGEYLIHEGEEDQDLYIVVKGSYTVERPPLLPGGPPVILDSRMCDPDHIAIVGEMAYFGDYRRTASVRSSGSTYTLCLKPQHIDVIMDGYPALTRVICQQFTRRLKEANDSIREFRSRFALVASKRMLSAGEILFEQGDPADVIYQLLVGEIELELGFSSTVVTHETLFQGFLEPEAYLHHRPHAATAIAREECILVSVQQKHRETLIRCYPELASRVLEG